MFQHLYFYPGTTKIPWTGLYFIPDYSNQSFVFHKKNNKIRNRINGWYLKLKRYTQAEWVTNYVNSMLAGYFQYLSLSAVTPLPPPPSPSILAVSHVSCNSLIVILPGKVSLQSTRRRYFSPATEMRRTKLNNLSWGSERDLDICKYLIIQTSDSAKNSKKF